MFCFGFFYPSAEQFSNPRVVGQICQVQQEPGRLPTQTTGPSNHIRGDRRRGRGRTTGRGDGGRYVNRPSNRAGPRSSGPIRCLIWPGLKLKDSGPRCPPIGSSVLLLLAHGGRWGSNWKSRTVLLSDRWTDRKTENSTLEKSQCPINPIISA